MKKVLLIVLAAAVVSIVVFAVIQRRPASVVTGESLLLTEPRFKTQIKTGGGLAGGPKSAPVTETGGGERALDAGKISSYAIKDEMLPIEVLTPKEMIFKTAMWIAGIAGAFLAFFAAAVLYFGREKKATPPDVEALVALRGLNADAQGRKASPQDFYSRLSSLAISYLIARFSLDKAEMTKSQILSALGNISGAPGAVRDELEGILDRAESVRYFGGEADVDRMVRDVEKVKDIIAATKVETK